MTNASSVPPAETVLHFIRCYRRLEQLPLEDGFAELACISTDPDEASQQQLKKHFRAHWYSKDGRWAGSISIYPITDNSIYCNTGRSTITRTPLIYGNVSAIVDLR
ncbi:hypothetical protein [Fibrella rubiginis]|uniref:hypothetical protein n=1 Tax=Fibrella rubiginis TaxID=2817060 RepID=UPI001E487F2D|nr:hypothetical protein [Fibrella rubiginis]